MPLRIVRDDIVRLKVDAIVNAANSALRCGGGVCGAIFAAAGAAELQRACDEIGHCDVGSSVATPGFALPARHVIHTVGPVWQGGTHGEEADLRSCYRTALALACELGDASIAFPLISSGIYGYPKEQALDVAIDEIRTFLDGHDMDVILVLFDAASHEAGRRRFADVAAYIDDLYVRRSSYLRRNRWERPFSGSASMPSEDAWADFNEPCKAAPLATASPQVVRDDAIRDEAVLEDRPHPSGLRRLLQRLDAPFSTTLLHMIDERGLKDSDVYKRANMSRQHFSKIRSNPLYRPKKHTVLALAVALELSLDDTRLLLERAGFALTHADKRDIIVEYYIRRREYDIHQINLALYSFDQPLLG